MIYKWIFLWESIIYLYKDFFFLKLISYKCKYTLNLLAFQIYFFLNKNYDLIKKKNILIQKKYKQSNIKVKDLR